MNKQELVETVAQRLDISKARAGEVVDLLFGAKGILATELRRGRRIQLTGFGSFETRVRAARTGRNPRTGGQIRIKASTVPAFRPGRALKSAVNGK